MSSPAFRSAADIRHAVATGATSATAILEETLARVDRLEPKLAAFLSLDRAAARRQAHAVDARVAAGDRSGALLGVPVALKDNLCLTGQPVTCGSKILEGYVAPYDAHVVERLAQAGAVFVGKTNLDEFAMGSSCENSAYQKTRNPWNLDCVPGGSSGGSAAVVAAGIVPLSLGSDTGGSIRQPAALCGVVGFKPTYGRVSRYGLVAFASSLDQIGPFSACVDDAAAAFAAMAGHDPRDSTTVDAPVPAAEDCRRSDLSGIRVGVHREYVDEIPDAQVRALVQRGLDWMKDAGATLVRIDDIDLLGRYALPTYYLVATSEASSNLARFDGMRYGKRAAAEGLAEAYSKTRGDRFGAEVSRRILLGTFALSSGYYDAYYKKALQVRRLYRQAFAKAFERCDVIAGGTSPIPAFPIGQKAADPLTMYACDVLTIPASLAGLPTISLPCGFTESRLPVGFQILGPPLEDARVLGVAHVFETKSGARGQLAPLAEVSA
ncbi:MAG: Asp-tRNA(Asn)/Glu-tRNA(Gln) amidotransferase subunit GatA [Planctomycetes bacterium]|nr:Asp-tRNA(Asn)/Glu-tRNA(Gln) amidotransferase subunit GatA [Planctomycetota bacterium]